MRTRSCWVASALSLAVWGGEGGACPAAGRGLPEPLRDGHLRGAHRRALHPPDPRQVSYQRRLPEALVRAEIVFLRWPDAYPRSPRAAARRSAIDQATVPGRALGEFLVAHSNLELRPEVLLSDGYLLTSGPALAVAFSSRLHLEQLFDAPRVYRARDGVVDVLERGDDGYVEPDGTLATVRATAIRWRASH